MGSSELFCYLPIPKSVLVQPRESDFKMFVDGAAEGRKEMHFAPFLNGSLKSFSFESLNYVVLRLFSKLSMS